MDHTCPEDFHYCALSEPQTTASVLFGVGELSATERHRRPATR